MRFFIETFGCQMNVNDSEIMAGLLIQAGYERSEDWKDADLIIVNTCAVRQKSEDKAYGFIGRLNKLKKEKTGMKIGVCGCVAEKERKTLFRRKGVDFIFGTRAIGHIVKNAERAFKGIRFDDFEDAIDDISFDTPRERDSKHHAWITIAYGCNKFCTYCIVPFTRDREKSRSMDDIVNEVRELALKGYKEITLLGQNVDSYGKDINDENITFANLLKEVEKADGIERIWFLTSYPSDFDEEVIDVMSSSSKFAPQVHLPVQAGSNNVLKKMNRRYTREEYIDLINRIKAKIPDVSLSSDIIVGFCGETDEDFEQTVDLVKNIRYEKLNLAMYSVREGTVASKTMEDDVPPEVKNKRLQILLNMQKDINREINDEYMDKTVRVIGEVNLNSDPTLMYGRTGRNKIVIFPAGKEKIGEWLNIKIERVTAGPLYGSIVD